MREGDLGACRGDTEGNKSRKDLSTSLCGNIPDPMSSESHVYLKQPPLYIPAPLLKDHKTRVLASHKTHQSTVYRECPESSWQGPLPTGARKEPSDRT